MTVDLGPFPINLTFQILYFKPWDLIYFIQELDPAIRCIFFFPRLYPRQKKKDAAAIGAMIAAVVLTVAWRPAFRLIDTDICCKAFVA